MFNQDFDKIANQWETALDTAIADLPSAVDKISGTLQTEADKLRADFLKADRSTGDQLRKLAGSVRKLDTSKLKKAIDIDLSPVKEFLRSRRKETDSAARLVSLFTYSNGQMLLDKFSKLVMDETTTNNTHEFDTLVKETEQIITGMAQDLPEEIVKNFAPAEELFSQFRAQAMQLFSSPEVADNVATLAAMGRDELVNKIGTFKEDMSSLHSSAMDTLNLIRDTVNNNSASITGFKDMIAGQLPQMQSTISDVLTKTAQLQSLIKSGGQYSTQRIDSITNALQTVSDTIGAYDSRMSSLYSQQVRDLAPEAASLTSNFQDIVDTGNRLASFREDMLDNINPGNIFNSVFSQVFSSLKNTKGILSAANSAFNSGVIPGNLLNNLSGASLPGLVDSTGSRSIEALFSVMGKVNAVKGIFNQFKQKRFHTALKDTTNPSVQQLKTLGQNILSQALPTDKIKKFENDVRAIVGSARRMIDGKIPKLPLLNAIESRLNSGLSEVTNALDTFSTALNAFTPSITSDAKAFFSSISSIAPAAASAISQCNVKAFEKCFNNPQYITLAGQAAGAIQSILSNLESTTIEDAAKLGTVLQYVAGFHQKTTMTAWLDNPSLQKSRSLKEIEYYAKTVIEPMERLVNYVESIKWA